MAVYAVGDVQGCYRTLRKLLARAGWREGRDRLWLAGDLVNRGPRSLEVLRFVRGLGAGAVAVLGNHDVHLLACAAGVARAKKKDTLDAVLAAPDRDELLSWLRARPLLHVEGARLLLHAGLLPRWSTAEAVRAARAAERALRGPRHAQVLAAARGPRERWDGSPGATVAVLTRMRVCTPRGGLRLGFNGAPGEAPPGTAPWFVQRGRRGREVVVCGHWAALGLHLEPGLIALDSGAVWGNKMSAIRLHDGAIWQQPLAD